MPRALFSKTMVCRLLVLSALLPLSTLAAEAPETLLTMSHATIRAIIAVQNRHTPDLMQMPEILGTAVGVDDAGRAGLVVYVDMHGRHAAQVVRALPARLSGVHVIVEMTEPFYAPIRVAPADSSGAAHRVTQTPPIQLGTSGGWTYDLANGFCCGGTLGALVQVGSVQYILSNYHVFWGDIVAGGNGRYAQTGDPVLQPGLVDASCNEHNAQDVATLAGSPSLPSTNVDAAVAQVIPGMVRTDGAILDIGTISANTRGAFLTQRVKKSGRTTGLTRSTVSGLNATISVTYDNECAGGRAFTKTFTGQILIKNRNRGVSFMAAGDSGSLMVEDVTTNPRAVGLLFAGNFMVAVANPIDPVLSFFGATMVGQ